MRKVRAFWSVVARNVEAEFLRPLGYVAGATFLVVATLLCFQPRFFAGNEVTLDQLTRWYPWLLLFVVPVLSMNSWSEEHRTKTSQLLLTLPLGPGTLVAAKFLAACCGYLLLLLSAFPILVTLDFLGRPDWGTIAATVCGYYVLGCALLAVGQLASALTSSSTVAFVLGAVFCSAFVFADVATPWMPEARLFSISEQLGTFSQGVVPLSSIAFAVAVSALALYLTHVVVASRTWRSAGGLVAGLHASLRTSALAVLLGSGVLFAAETGGALDWTAERLFTLTPATEAALDNVSESNPVLVQAFLSETVPPGYEDLRNRIEGLLKEYARQAGKGFELRVVRVRPDTPEADEARYFDIRPAVRLADRGGRQVEELLFLGVVVTGSDREVVLPFLDRATPLEHELTTAVASVTEEAPVRLGILETDARLLGETRDWAIVDVLRRSYDVRSVSPLSLSTGPESETQAGSDFDVLLVVWPSSLTAEEMDALVDHVRGGNPTLIFADPVPYFTGYSASGGLQQSPRQPKRGPDGRRPLPTPKADAGRATRLLRELGVRWIADQIVIDLDSPHPEYDYLTPEWVFISQTAGRSAAFNAKSEVTRGLDEVLTVFPGTMRPETGQDAQFTPLLRTGPRSGLLDFFDYAGLNPEMDARELQFRLQSGFFLRSDRPIRQDEYFHVVAARLQSEAPQRDVIFVADSDLLADWIVGERDANRYGLELDNVSFVLNAIDALAGRTDAIALRSRKRTHRPLDRMAELTTSIREREVTARLEAQQAADRNLQELREAGEAREAAIIADETLDDEAKQTQLALHRATQARVLAVRRAKIRQTQSDTLRRIRSEARSEIGTLERRIVWTAAALAPLPLLLVGCVIFLIRFIGEARCSGASDRS